VPGPAGRARRLGWPRPISRTMPKFPRGSGSGTVCHCGSGFSGTEAPTSITTQSRWNGCPPAHKDNLSGTSPFNRRATAARRQEVAGMLPSSLFRRIANMKSEQAAVARYSERPRGSDMASYRQESFARAARPGAPDPGAGALAPSRRFEGKSTGCRSVHERASVCRTGARWALRLARAGRGDRSYVIRHITADTSTAASNRPRSAEICPGDAAYPALAALPQSPARRTAGAGLEGRTNSYMGRTASRERHTRRLASAACLPPAAGEVGPAASQGSRGRGWLRRTALPELGRAEARSGLRMMPTFPRPPRSFRTAGFPQYGWRAGLPSSACPKRTQVKPAPGIPW
jgi:hypothetical protein